MLPFSWPNNRTLLLERPSFSNTMIKFTLRRRIQRRISTLRRCVRLLLDRILLCSGVKIRRYRMLPRTRASSPQPPPVVTVKDDMQANECCDDRDYMDCDDLVALKICLLGDHQVGKTSFLVKYAGKDIEWKGSPCPKKGIKWIDKTLFVRGARISHSIWEVEGDENFRGDHIPFACKDSVAILFMFDLTSRVSLNNVIHWYQQAREWNKTAIPIIVGTKFDDFIQLPIDIQWTIAGQARAYARVLNATLFFSSATYNINVNKIFKFITAKLFDLPWTVERNLTIGEPIIDF